MKDRLIIYVCSTKGLSALDYVDKESMSHPCVTSRHSTDIFTDFKHYPGSSGVLSEDQTKMIEIATGFCKQNDLEYKVVDIADLSFIAKMRLLLNGLKAPTITYKGKKLEGWATKEKLEALVG